MPAHRPARPAPRAVRPARCLTAAVVVLAALGLPAAQAAAAPAPARVAAAAPEPEATTVTVTGTGTASAAPDLALVLAGVETTGATPEKALAAHKTAADALLAAVRQAGVAERDIRTENLSVSPVYEQQDGTSKLTGYQATQTFSLKVRDTDTTGRVVKAAMDAAGDAGRVHSVTFDVADRDALRTRAREVAFRDARAKAEQYAKLSGRTLGRLVSLAESGGAAPHPLPAPAGALGKDEVPVAPGEIEDTVTLTAVYALD
ncbi:SIMPL domain-containing protein [Streptomyces sp. G45]|uniref:SIMPL domain-containing protein n=1 Tax=Streptomyces sp. G45 TaxID=3406627 RepID=UPI003C1614C1